MPANSGQNLLANRLQPRKRRSRIQNLMSVHSHPGADSLASTAQARPLFPTEEDTSDKRQRETYE